MTAPSTNSTNDANTASPQVSTASPNVNAASPQVSTASVSDNTVYAFMVENPNGSNVLHQDLEKIHEDDLEAIDLKWQLSAKECRAPRSKESQFRNQDNTRKQGNNEDKSSKAMLAIDGVGFDWSDMAEEQVQTNMALMVFSDFEVYTDKTCSKTCLKNYETLKKQCDDLLVKLNESEFKATTYKRGLATLEDQIITYKKNEVLFSEEIGVLKREVACKDYEINMLKSEFEKVKQEKDGIEFKIEKFDKASKDLDQLLGSQITDKCKKGLGYSVVPPPHPLIYNRPNKLDLSYSGLDEFKEPEFKGYGPKDSEQESNVVCDKKSDNSKENSEESLVEEQVSQDTSSFVESSPKVDKETVFPVNKKKNQLESQLGMQRCIDHKGLEGIREIGMKNYTYHQKKKVVSGNNYNRVDNYYYAKTSHHRTHKNVTPRAVLLRTGLKPLSTAKLFAFGRGAMVAISGKMCDKKNYVLFTNTECLVLSPNFKLPDENQILLKVPRKDNMYSFDMKNIVPKESLTCLVVKATSDESMLWHRRLGSSTELLVTLHIEILAKVFNSPCFIVKSWLVQDQTLLGKDYSNLLIADSLLKTIWFINAPCYGNEALASPKANELTIPEQTATGKGTSNPLMAGSLPKTTKTT
ncbi:hypothetical protein Tco_0304073 [Tanacetum coccineum]